MSDDKRLVIPADQAFAAELAGRFGGGPIFDHDPEFSPPPLSIIDCSADPFIPDGWSVAEHRRSGLL